MDRTQKRLNLIGWMETEQLDAPALARVMGLSRAIIYRYISDGPNSYAVGRSFKWRFAEHFGWETALQLFGESDATLMEETPHGHLTPA